MNSFTDTGLINLIQAQEDLGRHRNGHHRPYLNGHTNGRHHPTAPVTPPDPEVLRRVAWDIGQNTPAEAYAPIDNHVGVAMVSPNQGFVYWRLRHDWVEETARKRGNAWHQCRMIVRMYDVSLIIFDGFNAHSLQDHQIHTLSGQHLFRLPRAGTSQIAEVGFLLRDGEFIPAARSQAVQFPSDAASPRGSHAALLVNDRLRIEEVGNLWEQEKILTERRKPRARQSLRIATFTFQAVPTGQEEMLARFASELSAAQAAEGHEVHIFVPACDRLAEDCQIGGVHYHPLPVQSEGAALDQALGFARAADQKLQKLPNFDLLHLCDWMSGLAPWIGSSPTILSLSSIEATRRNGTAPSPLSLEIQQAERSLAHAADCVLTPDWLRDKAVEELGLDPSRVHTFPMEARIATEWDCPLDLGAVKREIAFGPLDRLILFVGPLEYQAGVDLLVEALPTVLRRVHNARLAFVGTGGMQGELEHRAGQLGVSHLVRFLGHQDSQRLARLLRASEAVVLPSRGRVLGDDGVIDLARRAGRPVVTTHSGPAHLVKHEETGVVTYDNPGSIVWAMDRIMGDPTHAECMGRKGRRGDGPIVCWRETARRFLDLCAESFPELRNGEH